MCVICRAGKMVETKEIGADGSNGGVVEPRSCDIN